MSHYLCYITCVARGESGRIVIEVEPETKRRLYSALALSGSTLKDWFIKAAAEFCADAVQPSLFIGKHLEPASSQNPEPMKASPAKGTSK